MNEIIKEAIRTYNLSSLEEYYLDKENRVRARGFVYDEDTGIFLNEYGLLEYSPPILEEGQEEVRAIFGFKVERPALLYLTKIVEPAIIKEEAVA